MSLYFGACFTVSLFTRPSKPLTKEKLKYLLNHEVGHVQLHVVHRLHDALEEGDHFGDGPELSDLVIANRRAKLGHQIQDVAGVGADVQDAVAGLLGDQVQVEMLHDGGLDPVLAREQKPDQAGANLLQEREGPVVNGRLFGELGLQDVPERLVHNLLDLELELGLFRLELLEHEVLVDGDLVSQEHVGDAASGIHQLVQRHHLVAAGRIEAGNEEATA